MVEDLEVRRGLRAPVCGRFPETVQGRVWIHVSLPDVHRQFLMAGRFGVLPVRRGSGMPGPYSGVVGLVSEPRWNVQVRIALGGGVRRRGRMRITTWLLSLLLSCVLVSGPRNGTRARPARPAMVCASWVFNRPATMAHSPNFSRACDLSWRFEITGRPFTDAPDSTLNAASMSSVTSSSSCTDGVNFIVRPRSSKLNAGGGR